MSEATKAIFLSYARDDATAARRIAEALRSAGLEVWFDESELRGGDQWDAKIRKQIDACTLFVPVISQHTQERSKGYFRLEWKLAVDQTHLLAEGIPFIAPVVIDDTRESAAVVPPEFMKVQWSRLPGALPTPQFVGQVKRLLNKEQGAGGKEQGRGRMTEDSPAPRKSGLPGWTWGALTAVIVGIAVALSVSRKPEPTPVAPVIIPSPASVLRPPTRSPVADAKSIAVLPFANRSNREEDLFFTDGVHDDLLTQISRIRAIKTISRTSVMGYRGTTKNMRTIGAELGVATILEGGIQRAGNRIRINVQLIDAATDAHLWAEIYDRELTAENIFKIQTEVATAIAAALRATLLPEEQKQLEKLPTSNLAALEAYFQGQTGYWKYSSTGMQEAAAHYQHAIDLDPDFVNAYAQLAGVYIHQTFFNGFAVETQTAKAERLIARALALEPQSSMVQSSLGLLKRAQRQPAEAEAAFQQAIALNPNYVLAYVNYSILLRWDLGRPAEALAMNAKARELEPRDPGLDSMAADYLMPLGRYDEARTVLEESRRKNPAFAQTYTVLGTLYGDYLNRPDLALEALRQGYALDAGSPVCALKIARLYDWVGEADRAVEWYERSLRLAPNDEAATLQRASIHRLRGEREKAWAVFETATASRDGVYYLNALLALRDRDLRAGRPQDARARYAAAFPALVNSPDPLVNAGNARVAVNIALVLAATGEKERATLLLNRAKAVTLADGNDGKLALVYAQQGETRQAVAALRRVVATGRYSAQMADGILADGLRGDPEFRALMAEVKDKLAADRQRLRELEASGTLAPIPPLPEEKK